MSFLLENIRIKNGFQIWYTVCYSNASRKEVMIVSNWGYEFIVTREGISQTKRKVSA